MSNHKNLLFFNKEGDNLNFSYNEINDRFEGSILFHENSSDTYKTAGIYTLEKIPSFEFEMPGELTLNKFQLFNEYGFDFYGSNYTTQSITRIEPINNDPSFYSKWIYGELFDKKFPLGSIIRFDTPLLEFTNLLQTYTVVGNKKNAIMILSSMDNATFETSFINQYGFDITYIGKSISGINAIGVYNYIDTSYKNNLSLWNEPNFYDKLYKNKKLNIINSKSNDKTVTIKEEEVTDCKFFEYYTESSLVNSDIIIEVSTKTDLPKIYDGSLNISQISNTLSPGGYIASFTYTSNAGVDNVYTSLTSTGLSSSVTGTGANFDVVVSGGLVTNVISNKKGYNYSIGDTFIIDGSDIGGTTLVDDIVITITSIGDPVVTNENRISFGSLVPEILKPGREFKIIGSNDNQNFFTVANIPTFNGNSQQTFYATQSQVLFNNKVYECVQAYTQSYATSTTQFVTPEDTSYWTPTITYINVNEGVTNEFLSNCQIYLTTDKLYFQHGFTQSGEVTLASAAEKFVDDFESLNVELYYEKNKIKADLMYPSRYVEVKFYNGNIGNTYSIGSITETNERLIQVSENLTKELNYDFSSNHSVNIVFTDLDEFGLKIKINKQVYEAEIAWVYSGTAPDMERTIDRTLRSWLTRNFLLLQKLGIIADLQYIGSFVSPFYNSIKLRTEYPNVEMVINEISVGITANYYVEHSRVLFNDLGGYLSIDINNDVYDQSTIYQSGTYSQYPDIPATLQAWVEEHSQYLSTFGIIVSSINNLLKFDTLYLDRRLEYTIKTGKSHLPGMEDFLITNKIKGNNGALITSNELRLTETAYGTYSFEDAGFATGMAFSINNTFHTWNNTEFNIQYLEPGVLNLSYQGPFWSTSPIDCNSSAFITLAFEVGFGQTACGTPVGPTGGSIGGPFNEEMFGAGFSIAYNGNNYVTNTYNLQSYSGTSNLVDIMYVQLSNSIYSLGDDITVMDAYLATYLTNISLPGNTQSQFLRFNTVNNYLYAISKQIVYVIDPLLNTVLTSWSYTNTIKDVAMNPVNGDIFISFNDVAKVEIRNSNNTIVSNLTTSSSNFPGDATSMGKMVFNNFEADMYIITDSSIYSVLRVNGSTRDIQTGYGVPGATGSIFYEPVNESVYVFGSSNLWKIDNGLTQSLSITTGSFNDIIFNNLTGEMNLSDSSTQFRGIDLNTNSVSFNTSIGNYGYLALNQYDGDVYISSIFSNVVLVANPVNGNIIKNIPMSAMTGKVIYNPERKSIWTIQPSINSVVEVEVTVNSSIIPTLSGYQPSEDNQYGTLSPDYQPYKDVWLKTKEYLRRPRENFQGETQVEYYWKWYSDIAPEFFMYDFSGTQLPISGSYAYTGPKPLTTAVLNKQPNRDLTKCSAPEFQQTIFDKVNFTLSYIDDENDISTAPEPMELFIGFKSEEEGALRSILQLYKKESVSVSYDSTSTNNTVISFETLDVNGPDKRGFIKINTNSNETFTEKGLKAGQLIAIYVKDVTNNKQQYISSNNGRIVKIRNVFFKSLVVDFLSSDDFLSLEETVISNYPSSGKTTYCRLDINVIDKEIGRFITYGQTEIEDIRFKIELGNVGKLVAPNEVFIFKDYDILEGGIDWTFLNKKRKEMLMMKHLIYPYIGSYKSIINAINFFGYNDLQLNEYYRNINPQSEKFLKLFKIEIPDIFDNTVEGWTESEFIKNNFPNDDYEETNMFNLTYNITDKEGTNVITYSIDEIIIKLQGLKYWLKRNIIPLTHKILDITGKAYFRQENQIIHTSYDTQIVNIKQNMTPISFKLNEAYLMPINSGSTVYNCVIDFYTINPGIGADKNPTGLVEPPKPYNGVSIDLPDYFDVTIRTYKTYKEWAPFTTYNTGDKVSYYGKIYESQIDNNKIKNPRKYENVPAWIENSIYSSTNTVEYKKDIFVYSGLGSTQSTTTPPLIDTQNWLKITEWKEVNWEPVQTIKEYRRIPKGATPSTVGTLLPPPNPIPPFNFTVDSNIDPFIVIEVTSDNGYGLIYRDKKNYEIRGTKDLTEPTEYIDLIGPFEPIEPILPTP